MLEMTHCTITAQGAPVSRLAGSLDRSQVHQQEGAHRFEQVASSVPLERRLPREAKVNNGGHTGHGQAALCNVRCQDYPSLLPLYPG